MKKCPFCAEEIDDDSKKCKHCKSDFIKKCPFCAEEVKNEATKCKHCGSDFGSKTNNSNAHHLSKSKSKTTAGLLALFLGGLGIHKFYLGQSIGILYILFCWTFIPSIIAFVEAIMLFLMTEENFDRTYNK